MYMYYVAIQLLQEFDMYIGIVSFLSWMRKDDKRVVQGGITNNNDDNKK